MGKKHTNKKKSHHYRKFIALAFGVSFLALLAGFGILQFMVYLDNNHEFSIQLENASVEELEDSIAVYINASQSWTSVERGENYEKGVQYDGIIENNTKKEIKEWQLTIYLPQKGVIDSAWNGTFEEASDTIIVTPLEYNKKIPVGGEQTFGFVLYSADQLEFEKFQVAGYRGTVIKDYPAFWILLLLSMIWVVCLSVYIWVYISIRKLEMQREKDKQTIAQAMEAFAHLVDAKDQYTQEHSLRVALYSEEIAKRSGMSEEEATQIRYIALVHDCGKIGVPDAVLNKRGPLNGGEREIINSHTVLGGNVLQHFTAIDGIREGALYHHERYDGNGYPSGLKGKKIPLCARIIGIADSYDAMSSDRCYRKHLDKEQILKELNENSGKQFDPDLVKYMLDMIEDGFTYQIHHYDDEDREINNLENVFS